MFPVDMIFSQSRGCSRLLGAVELITELCQLKKCYRTVLLKSMHFLYFVILQH